MRVFRYFSGETVEVGDHVRDAGRLGRVTEIIQPGSDEAASYSCPDGGVRTVVDWDGTSSNAMWEPPDGDLWEDLEFLSRQS